ncbi:hypothetical protein HYZ98_02710 [Candidatus Peregrinibacteria bacterium]|nr:hypothetical protein [Candidatus Peregrinibacteria bacterium]
MSPLESSSVLEAAETSSLAAVTGIVLIGALTVRGIWNLFHHKGMLSGAKGKIL